MDIIYQYLLILSTNNGNVISINIGWILSTNIGLVSSTNIGRISSSRIGRILSTNTGSILPTNIGCQYLLICKYISLIFITFITLAENYLPIHSSGISSTNIVFTWLVTNNKPLQLISMLMVNFYLFVNLLKKLSTKWRK